VAQEGVGLDGEGEKIFVDVPVRVRDRAREAAVLAFGEGEGREVVGAGQLRRAGVQGVAVDGLRPPQGAAALEDRGRAAVQNAVDVAAGGRVAPSVEAVAGGGDLQDVDVGRQDRVEALALDGVAGVGGDLPGGVDTSVGPTGRDGRRRRAGQDGERPFQLVLNRAAVGLPCPPGEMGPVVFDEELRCGDGSLPCGLRGCAALTAAAKVRHGRGWRR